jgi:hypothetical protein
MSSTTVILKFGKDHESSQGQSQQLLLEFQKVHLLSLPRDTAPQIVYMDLDYNYRLTKKNMKVDSKTQNDVRHGGANLQSQHSQKDSESEASLGYNEFQLSYATQ